MKYRIWDSFLDGVFAQKLRFWCFVFKELDLSLFNCLLSKFKSVKIYWLSVKFDWFKLLKRGYCKSVNFHWLFQWKFTDFTVKNIFFTDESVKINWFNSEKYFSTDESVKRQITDSISENLTDSDLEST